MKRILKFRSERKGKGTKFYFKLIEAALDNLE